MRTKIILSTLLVLLSFSSFKVSAYAGEWTKSKKVTFINLPKIGTHMKSDRWQEIWHYKVNKVSGYIVFISPKTIALVIYHNKKAPNNPFVYQSYAGNTVSLWRIKCILKSLDFKRPLPKLK